MVQFLDVVNVKDGVLEGWPRGRLELALLGRGRRAAIGPRCTIDLALYLIPQQVQESLLQRLWPQPVGIVGRIVSYGPGTVEPLGNLRNRPLVEPIFGDSAEEQESLESRVGSIIHAPDSASPGTAGPVFTPRK